MTDEYNKGHIGVIAIDKMLSRINWHSICTYDEDLSALQYGGTLTFLEGYIGRGEEDL